MVVVGSSKSILHFLGKELIGIKTKELPAYNVNYSGSSLVLSVLKKVPSLLRVIKEECKIIESLQAEENFDLVISDNRYGLYLDRKPSYIICHQLNFKLGPLSQLVSKIHNRFLKKFTGVLIPDNIVGIQSLAGDLSKNNYQLSVEYIGPLSRLKKNETRIEFKLAILLSGPEPKFSQFAKAIKEAISELDKSEVIVVSPKELIEFQNCGIKVYVNPDAELLSKLLSSSEYVLGRSGYSSLMDFHAINKSNLVLIPTEGQPEQEYLANYWHEKFNAIVIPERLLDMENLNQALNKKGSH
ncbi:MAG: glycosyltransferase [Bacteroidia bacterium]